MSLYGKYRPQNFANLVGQDHIRQTLLHEIQQGHISHAYLFCGPRGTGKTSTARLIAKALNCENLENRTASDNGEPRTAGLRGRSEIGSRGSQSSEAELTKQVPCEECDFCKTITEGNLIDVIEIDAASNRGIDEIRELKEKINFAPTRAKTKTYIIDEVHMLTKEAFNALLKTLEEPPENVYFILCTTEIHKIPETIISRCQRFDFKRIDVRTLMTRLNYIAQMEKIEAEDAAIELIARHVEGGMRDAIGLLEQMTIENKLLADHVREHLGITGHTTIAELIELLEKNEMAKAIRLVNEVHNEGYDLTSFVREILECLRDKLINGIQQGQAHREHYPDNELWLEMIGRFEEARDMLRSTVIPQLPLEIAVIKICESVVSDKGKVTSEKKEEQEKETELTKQETATAQILKREYETEQYRDGLRTAEPRDRSEIGSRGPQSNEVEPINSGNISTHWPRVIEHVQPPSLRRSLSEAKMSEGKDGEVKLLFSARFHMEKVNLIENRAKIEKAITHIFGKTVKLTCSLDPTAAAPKSEPATGAAHGGTPINKLEAGLRGKRASGSASASDAELTNQAVEPKIDLAKRAMEMFGEE